MRDWHLEWDGYGLFTVILRQSGEIIGDCGLERMEIAEHPAARATAELGYDLRSNHWNRGLATEAASAVRDHAFDTLHLPRLVSLIRQGNVASRRVAEKIGRRYERDILRSGHPYWIFRIDAPDHAFAEDQPPPLTT